ncbi:CDP-alcohol phosphatidyltransferase family protein [Microbacterium sp. NPDC019599]|uniref:CDP-alcohol phosphatidyltransferase family protein n=1 Tax=Microbacterium sp. NPDC019599 TaxID=3154690 RepID=UPI0033DDD9A2
MPRVQVAPLSSAIGGVAGLVVLSVFAHVSPPGWIAACAYLVVSNALLARGLRRSGMPHFGWANATTAVRSTLVALVTALVVTSFTDPVPAALLVGIAVPALALDAVDGWVARSTHTQSELGARFDMEVDAFVLLVLSAYVAQDLGWWVLTIGALRYLFVAAGWALPWMNATLPPRYWRKVVTASAGIALVVAASGLFPAWVAWGVTLAALALLLESFGRDVLWLVRHRAVAAPAAMPAESRSLSERSETKRHPEGPGDPGLVAGLDFDPSTSSGTVP